MVNVVGGTYWEHSREEDWNELFGSGLRACAALGSKVELTSCFAKVDSERVNSLRELFNFKLDQCLDISRTVRFFYPHGLASPIFDRIDQRRTLEITSDRILRFGMVECDPVVHGDWVVYDPQAPGNPESFSKNGSSANHLAIVCNRNESLRLTGEQEISEAAKKLSETENAETVVIKCGGEGAFVFSKTEVKNVPAFQTRNVWPIGSGDVFSAIFFDQWVKSQDPFLAASLASKGAAYYCGTKNLPVAPEFEKWFERNDPPETIGFDANVTPRVYLAGPFFNMMQRWMVEEARTCLFNHGLDVFSPFHDVGIGPAKDVVPQDVEAIEKCDAMFAIVDHLDSGTLFEIGYATAKGIPVVGFAQDVTNERLKMLLGTGCEVHSDFVSAIYKMSWIAHEKAKSNTP